MTAISRASSAASAKSWVTRTVGAPRLAPGSRRARAPAEAAVRESSAESGSSSSSTAGSRASARASATRWRSPPESSRTGASASASAPKRPRSSTARARRSLRRDTREPEGDVAPGVQVREQRVLLEQVAAAAPLGRQVDPGLEVEPAPLAERSPSPGRAGAGRRSSAAPCSCRPPRARPAPGSPRDRPRARPRARTRAACSPSGREAPPVAHHLRLRSAEQRRAAQQLHREQQRGGDRDQDRGERERGGEVAWRRWRRSPAAPSG